MDKVFVINVVNLLLLNLLNLKFIRLSFLFSGQNTKLLPFKEENVRSPRTRALTASQIPFQYLLNVCAFETTTNTASRKLDVILCMPYNV